MSNFIPVFEPDIGEAEISSVLAALKRGDISGSFGKDITDFEDSFAAYCGCKYGIAVTSGTTALHLAVAALELPEGSEVLVSSSTNIATALAAYHNRMIPVGIDSEIETWNLDLDYAERVVTPRTRAIIPVHLFGHPVDMDSVEQFAKKHGLYVIEDCAEAHGAEVRGKRVGGLSDMGCFSFYANKIITTGEGGMITTNNETFANRIRLLRNLGFTQPRFRHEVAGYNMRMTAYQAAMGVVQTARLDQIVEAKRRMGATYTRHLESVEGLALPVEKEWAKHVYWMYGILVTPKFGMTRDELMKALKENGIDTRTFFHPINSQPCFRQFNNPPAPVAETLWENGLYLPSSHTLSEEKIAFICETIKSIQAGAIA